jgi:hypothetical protein
MKTSREIKVHSFSGIRNNYSEIYKFAVLEAEWCFIVLFSFYCVAVLFGCLRPAALPRLDVVPVLLTRDLVHTADPVGGPSLGPRLGGDGPQGQELLRPKGTGPRGLP